MYQFPLRPALPVLSRLMVASLGAVILLAAFAGYTAPPAAAAPRKSQSPFCNPGDARFTHTATSANTHGNYSDLDDPCRVATVVVTPSFDGQVYDPHVLGVWYNSSTQRWSIFHQDMTPLPVGATYHIEAVISSSSSQTAFLQTATTANSFGDLTVIHNPLTDNQPNITLLVIENWTASGGLYDPHPLGVYYIPLLPIGTGEWAIFHEDGTPISPGTTFNVVVHPRDATNQSIIQTATTANSRGDFTEINNPPYSGPTVSCDGIPNCGPAFEIVMVTADFTGAVYDSHPLGVWFNNWDGFWTIFHEDGTPIPLGATYSVFFG